MNRSETYCPFAEPTEQPDTERAEEEEVNTFRQDDALPQVAKVVKDVKDIDHK